MSEPNIVHMRFGIGLVFSCAILFLTACGDEPSESRDIVRPVKIMTVENAGGSGRKEYSGVVATVRTVKIGFEVSGKLIEFPIRESQDVEKNDLLGRLDPEDYLAERNSAASQRRAMDAAYKRAKNIFDQGAGSQADLDNALRNIQVANERLKKAQKALNDTYLRAPFSGKIAETYVDNFQNVQAKEPVLLMHDLDTLKIEVTVPEKDFALSKSSLSYEDHTKQMKPEVTISGLPGKHFPAVLYSYTTSADPTTRTYIGSFRFSNTSGHYVLPGMTAKLSILANSEDQHNIIEIPASAVISNDQKQSSVWRIDPQTMRASQLQVELGTLSGKYIQVLNGLRHGDLVAISGVHHLREGMEVRNLDKKMYK